MTSSDVRDMLNLPASSAPRPSKKAKSSGPKTTLRGLAREVAGLAGDTPISIVPEATHFKKRRLTSKKPAAKWDSRPFTNSARHDGLVLRHWRRQDVPVPPPSQPYQQAHSPSAIEMDGEAAKKIEDSTFAKYNVWVTVPKYTDEMYTEHLTSEEWSKDETDYLLGLVSDSTLR